MNKIIFFFKVGLSVIISGFGYFMGGFDTLFVCLASLMAIDYITGVFAAVVSNKLSSRTGFLGIIKKMCIFAVVAVATVLGSVTGVSGIRNLAVSFYIANEGVSILENLGKVGVPLPPKIKEVLIQLKEEEQ